MNEENIFPQSKFSMFSTTHFNNKYQIWHTNVTELRNLAVETIGN